MKAFKPPIEVDPQRQIRHLQMKLDGERKARLEAEAIAERGLRELYESQLRLALLQQITHLANNSDDFDEVLGEALGAICHHMGWDFGNAYRISADGKYAEACDSWYASDPDRLFTIVEASRRRSFASGVCLPGRVLRDGHPHWIDDFTPEGAWFFRQSIALDAGLVSACAFPIIVGETLVGVIEFFSRKVIFDKDAVLMTVSQAANQLARVVERERAHAALLHDALHDALTGLPNRVLLAERARAAFDRLGPDRAGLAVLVIDLDGFKAINDKYGHGAGDQLLIATSARLSAILEAEQATDAANGHGWFATLARTGGDEFVVVIDGAPTLESARAIALRAAQALHDCLREPVQVGGDTVTVGASIGVAHAGKDHRNIEQLLNDADLAMYEAKVGGHGGVIEFTDAMGAEARNRMALERELRDAIRDRQFVLHYQPIFALDQAAQVRGFEALIRWNHPQRGQVDPGKFIPAAESSGLIVFIGDWVLRQACLAIARLHRRLAGDPTFAGPLPFISINIAPTQFLQPGFAAQVQRVMIETGVTPACLRLEVTEGVAIIDPDRTRQVLDEIRSWGVHTSLDDFGTGYSSLSYLRNLPFDTLKIDRSFIASIDDPKSRNIIRAILDMARHLDISVVAEGIESPEQGRALQEMGCQFGQGFLLGRPLDETHAFALLDIGKTAA